MAGVTLLETRRRIFVVHLILFLLIMGGLAALNFTFTPAVIWFVYPLIAWGFGLIMHFLSAVAWARGTWDETKSDWKSRIWIRLFAVHLAVYVAVSSLLLFINLTYSPHLLWVLFAIVPWGIGVIMHLVLTLLWAPGSGASQDDSLDLDVNADS